MGRAGVGTHFDAGGSHDRVFVEVVFDFGHELRVSEAERSEAEPDEQDIGERGELFHMKCSETPVMMKERRQQRE